MSAARYAAKTAYRGTIATRYDADRKVEPLWEQEQAFVRDWIARLPAGAVVLDLPVGTGRFLPLFAGRGLEVHGFDISSDMVAEARRQYAGLGAAIHLEVGDAEQVALPDQSVDCVVCWRFFHLIPPPVIGRVLREFRRVCRGPILVQVLQVKPRGQGGGWWAGVKDVLRPWYRRLRPRQDETPWAHITSYPHAEEGLLESFRVAGLSVKEEVELQDASGLLVKMYTLER